MEAVERAERDVERSASAEFPKHSINDRSLSPGVWRVRQRRHRARPAAVLVRLWFTGTSHLHALV